MPASLRARKGPFRHAKGARDEGAIAALALGELRALAGLLETVLLALYRPRVAGEHPRGLELAAGFLRLFGEGAGYAVTQRFGLPGRSSAFDLGDDLVAAGGAEEFQRRAHRRAVGRAGEVLVQVTTVHGDPAVSRQYPHPRNGGLASSGSDVQSLRHLLHLELLRVLGRVWMLGARVDLQLLELLAGEPGLRHHPVDGFAQDLGRLAREHLLVARLLHAAGIARVTPVDPLLGLPARDGHPVGVYDDNEVAHVDVWRVVHLGLAAQDACDLRRQTPEVLALSVNDVPFSLDLKRPRHVTLHHPPEVLKTSKAFRRIK